MLFDIIARTFWEKKKNGIHAGSETKNIYYFFWLLLFFARTMIRSYFRWIDGNMDKRHTISFAIEICHLPENPIEKHLKLLPFLRANIFIGFPFLILFYFQMTDWVRDQLTPNTFWAQAQTHAFPMHMICTSSANQFSIQMVPFNIMSHQFRFCFTTLRVQCAHTHTQKINFANAMKIQNKKKMKK